MMTEIFANDHRCKRRSKMDIDYVGIGSMMMAIRMVLKIPIMMMMTMKMEMVLKIPTLILRRQFNFTQVGQVHFIITTTSSSYLLHSTLMSFGFFLHFDFCANDLFHIVANSKRATIILKSVIT